MASLIWHDCVPPPISLSRSTVSKSTLTVSTLVRSILPRSTQIFSKSTHRFLGTAIWVWLIQVKLTKWGTNYSKITLVVEELDCGPKVLSSCYIVNRDLLLPSCSHKTRRFTFVCFGHHLLGTPWIRTRLKPNITCIPRWSQNLGFSGAGLPTRMYIVESGIPMSCM